MIVYCMLLPFTVSLICCGDQSYTPDIPFILLNVCAHCHAVFIICLCSWATNLAHCASYSDHCYTFGAPEPKITWTVDDYPISDNFEVLDNGTLLIRVGILSSNFRYKWFNSLQQFSETHNSLNPAMYRVWFKMPLQLIDYLLRICTLCL